MTLPGQQVWERHQGDQDESVEVRLDGISTIVGGTFTGVVARGLGTPVVLTALITDAPGRIVTVQLNPWLDDAQIGDWRFVVRGLFSGGGVGPWTWPQRGHNIIRVHGPV